LLQPIAIFGCSCKSRLKVANSFTNSRPVNRFPLAAQFSICKIRTIRHLWKTYIHTNHSLLLDAPVISQHVFTSGQKSLSCSLQTGFCFLSHPLPSVSLLGFATSLPKGNTYGLPSSKLWIIIETLGATFRPET
jgi:hypothetical protein